MGGEVPESGAMGIGLAELGEMPCIAEEAAATAATAAAATLPLLPAPATLGPRVLRVEVKGMLHDWFDVEEIGDLLRSSALMSTLRENLTRYFGVPLERQAVYDEDGLLTTGADFSRALQRVNPKLYVYDVHQMGAELRDRTVEELEKLEADVEESWRHFGAPLRSARGGKQQGPLTPGSNSAAPPSATAAFLHERTALPDIAEVVAEKDIPATSQTPEPGVQEPQPLSARSAGEATTPAHAHVQVAMGPAQTPPPPAPLGAVAAAALALDPSAQHLEPQAHQQAAQSLHAASAPSLQPQLLVMHRPQGGSELDSTRKEYEGLLRRLSPSASAPQAPPGGHRGASFVAAGPSLRCGTVQFPGGATSLRAEVSPSRGGAMRRAEISPSRGVQLATMQCGIEPGLSANKASFAAPASVVAAMPGISGGSSAASARWTRGCGATISSAPGTAVQAATPTPLRIRDGAAASRCLTRAEPGHQVLRQSRPSMPGSTSVAAAASSAQQQPQQLHPQRATTPPRFAERSYSGRLPTPRRGSAGQAPATVAVAGGASQCPSAQCAAPPPSAGSTGSPLKQRAVTPVRLPSAPPLVGGPVGPGTPAQSRPPPSAQGTQSSLPQQHIMHHSWSLGNRSVATPFAAPPPPSTAPRKSTGGNLQGNSAGMTSVRRASSIVAPPLGAAMGQLA